MKTLIVFVAFFACTVFAQQDEFSGHPPFLEGAPQSTIQEFEKLLSTSAGLTDAQIDAKVDTWIQGQSATIKTKYVEFKAQLKTHQSAAEAAHQAAIAKFSPAAKEADAKLSAIANNPSLSAQAKGQQIGAIMSALPSNVRQEIEQAMQG